MSKNIYLSEVKKYKKKFLRNNKNTASRNALIKNDLSNVALNWENFTQINHNFPNCESNQCYKGILTDHAKASYLSKTFVKKIAQKTEAYQLSKGILMSEDCYFHSKPELRIFADDVKCSHGSTIGPIDKDLLFYLRSRGLNKKESISLLIKSFFHDIISKINDKKYVEKFNYHSSIWLKENNI